jgi:hypothetical protein
VYSDSDMQFGFIVVCLILVPLCHQGLALEPLADSRMGIRILKRGDPREEQVMFTGNDPLMGEEKINGQLFRISKRKEQDRIIHVIGRQFHPFLLKYDTQCYIANFIFKQLFTGFSTVSMQGLTHKRI